MALIPARLGPYEIVARVGAGGMGEVYKATDTRLGRTVAIKVLPAHGGGDHHGWYVDLRSNAACPDQDPITR